MSLLFMIELGSLRVRPAGVTCHPTGLWVAQQARSLLASLGEHTTAWKFLIRDRDARFTTVFDDVWRSIGEQLVMLAYETGLVTPAIPELGGWGEGCAARSTEVLQPPLPAPDPSSSG